VSNFKPGDVVELKSGGPKMTIESIDADGCFCRWFIDKKIECGTFKPETLRLAEDLKTIRPQ
jgi:uncharacterized protein YodC (DUF2158 family)